MSGVSAVAGIPRIVANIAVFRQPAEDDSGCQSIRRVLFGIDPRRTPVPNNAQPELDALDRAMLDILGDDARITNQRLAERIGVAPSTALARMRSLRARGVIQGFHTEVDLAALGRPLQAMIAVRLAVHAREQIDAFTQAVRALPGVLMVFHLTGVTDYLVWVAAADPQDLREFVVDHLATHPSVAHAETSLIYEHRRGPGIWGAADPA
jgi:DNA-binding Lrp family transcriptional regulator